MSPALATNRPKGVSKGQHSAKKKAVQGPNASKEAGRKRRRRAKQKGVRGSRKGNPKRRRKNTRTMAPTMGKGRNQNGNKPGGIHKQPSGGVANASATGGNMAVHAGKDKMPMRDNKTKIDALDATKNKLRIGKGTRTTNNEPGDRGAKGTPGEDRHSGGALVSTVLKLSGTKQKQCSDGVWQFASVGRIDFSRPACQDGWILHGNAPQYQGSMSVCLGPSLVPLGAVYRDAACTPGSELWKIKITRRQMLAMAKAAKKNLSNFEVAGYCNPHIVDYDMSTGAFAKCPGVTG